MIQPSFSASPGGAAFDTTLIERSAWFDGAADRMAKTFGSDTRNGKGVISVWVRRHQFGTRACIIETGGVFDMIEFDLVSGQLHVRMNNQDWTSNALYRDISWYHILVSWDMAAVGTARVQVLVNGEEISYLARPTLSTQPSYFRNVAQNIGSIQGSSTFWKGSMAQFTALDGRSIQNGDYTVASFLDTYTFGVNGSQYVPKADADIAALATAAGGNSFCLTTAIGDGTDASGNGNNFTPTSMSDAANGSADTPSLVYPMLTPLDRADTGIALFNDSNEFTINNAANGFARATMSADTGKFYFELDVDGLPSANFIVGMAKTTTLNTTGATTSGGFGIQVVSTGAINLYEDGSAGASQETGVTDAAHTFQCAVDFDSGKFWFGRDDTWYGSGDPAAGTNETGTFTAGTRMAPMVGRHSSNTTSREQRLVWDSGSFGGTMPTGFLEWSSANMPTPVRQGRDHFAVALDTEANILATLATERSGWTSYVDILKNRTNVEKWFWRFSDDGSNEHAINVGDTFQANTALSGSDNWLGYSIRTDQIAYQEVGVSHTNGAATTITHNLGTTDVAIWLFNQAGGDVWLYTPQLTAGKLLKSSTVAAETTDTSITNVLSNSFDIGSADATGTYDVLVVAMGDCFHATSYVGNAAADGAYIAMPFKPRTTWLKDTTDAAGDHFAHDTERDTNEEDKLMFWNLDDIELTNTAYSIDILSGAVKMRNATITNGATLHIAMAFADIRGGGDLPPIYGR